MGSLLTFVNTVADEVARRHPGARIGTLSCQYSRKPPRFLKPRPNVQIQLCSIECSVLQPMDEAAVKVNAAFADDLRGWARICEDISIWTYNTNFRNYLLPCPNLRVIEPNIRFFVANNVRGIYMQGAYHAMGAEFSELRLAQMRGLARFILDSADEIDLLLRRRRDGMRLSATAALREFAHAAE